MTTDILQTFPHETRIIPALASLAVPIDSIFPDPVNAMEHPTENIGAIAASLARYGQRKPVVVNAKDRIIEAGNGTLTAAKSLGWTEIAAVFIEDDPASATGYAIADNRTSQLSYFDMERLSRLLASFANPTEIPGISADYLKEVQKAAAGKDGGEASDGSLLSLVDVAIREPAYGVEYGDVYQLGGKHVLACLDVFRDWSQYLPFLDEETAVFLPYPGPFVALAEDAPKFKLVLVQPERYICGHILEKFAEVHGHESIRKLV